MCDYFGLMKRRGTFLVLAGATLFLLGLILVLLTEGFGPFFLMVGAIPFLLLTLLKPLDSLQQLLVALRWSLPLLVFLIVSPLAQLLASAGNNLFYEATAQIIPILVLSLALESRSVAPTVRSGFEAGLAVFLFLGLGLGEYSALRAIFTGNADSGDLALVVGALAAGFTGVVTLALIKPD